MKKSLFTASLKFLVLWLVVFIPQNISAQSSIKPSNTRKLAIGNNANEKKLSISFLADKIIDNVLVLVTDQKGRIIFLDNRYRFTGENKQAVDLRGAAPGDLQLQIINDQEHFNHKITMR